MTTALLAETRDELRRIVKRINKKHEGLILAGAVVGSVAREKYYGKDDTDLDILLVVKDPFKAKDVLERSTARFSNLQKSFSNFDIFVETLEIIEKVRKKIALNDFSEVLKARLDTDDVVELKNKPEVYVVKTFNAYWRMLYEARPFLNKEFFDKDLGLVNSKKQLREIGKELLRMKKELRVECEKILKEISAIEKEHPNKMRLTINGVRLVIKLYLRHFPSWMYEDSMEKIQEKKDKILNFLRKEVSKVKVGIKRKETDIEDIMDSLREIVKQK